MTPGGPGELEGRDRVRSDGDPLRGTGSGVHCDPSKGVSSRTRRGSRCESRRLLEPDVPGSEGRPVQERTPWELERRSVLEVLDRGTTRRLPDPGTRSALVDRTDTHGKGLTDRVTYTLHPDTPRCGGGVTRAEGDSLPGTDDT